MRRSVFVFFSYALIAVRKMVRKLVEDVEPEVVWDIIATQGCQIGWSVDEREAARPSKRSEGHSFVSMRRTLTRSFGDDWR